MVIAAARGYHIDRNPDAMPPVGSIIDPTGGMASRRAKLQVRRSGRYAVSQKKTTVLLPPNDVRLGFIWLQTEPIGTQPTVY